MQLMLFQKLLYLLRRQGFQRTIPYPRQNMIFYATYLEEHLNGFPHYDDEVVRKMIERVTVVDAETIRVKFRYSDLEIEQSVC